MSVTDERRWILKLSRDGGYELAWATESKTEGWWLSADQVETMFAEWQASRTPEAAPSDTDEPTEREKVLDEVFTNLADQGWDVAIADDPVKGVSIDIQPVPSDTDKDTFTASNGYKVDRLADGQTKITRSTNGAFEAVTWCGGDEYLAIAEHALSRSQPVQVDPREVAHIECDCVPDLGPSHCHLCSERAGHPVPWSEAHPAQPSTVTQGGME